MSAALYVGLACAAVGVLFWIAALVLFPLKAEAETGWDWAADDELMRDIERRYREAGE